MELAIAYCLLSIAHSPFPIRQKETPDAAGAFCVMAKKRVTKSEFEIIIQHPDLQTRFTK